MTAERHVAKTVFVHVKNATKIIANDVDLSVITVTERYAVNVPANVTTVEVISVAIVVTSAADAIITYATNVQ